jgi:hypothetical protein
VKKMLKTACCSILLLTFLLPVSSRASGIEDLISAYTGANAHEYLRPLADAFGANLNSGLFHSASVPPSGIHLSLEVTAMAVIFKDKDRTFMGTPEGDFSPKNPVEVPTVIGSGRAVIVSGDHGTSFIFPGGFDLHSFGIIVPQLRIGTVAGTEALVRYLAFDTGDETLGRLSLFGFGLRHSISQYLGPAPPLDIAAGFFWQRFKLGENDEGGDLLSTSALSIGLQASKDLVILRPYAGLSVDNFSMNVDYVSDASGEPERIDFEYISETATHLTFGLSLNLLFVSVNGEYSISNQNNFSVGIAIGNL